MKSTTQTSFFIFFLCILFYAPLPAISGSLYESLCNEYRPSQNIKPCLMLLKTDSRVTSATNYHDLSKYLLEMTLNDAGAVQNYFHQITVRFPTDDAIIDCFYFYETSIRALNSALSALDKDHQSAINNAQTAGFGAVNCEKAFEKPKERDVRAKLHLRNNEIFLLSAVASLAITHLTY